MNTSKITHKNDRFRQSFIGGKVVITRGVQLLSIVEQMALFKLVQAFDDFNEENDPFNEHDFGAIEFNCETYFFKIDYYDIDYLGLSPDPSDDTVTNRVLTIMKAEEY